MTSASGVCGKSSLDDLKSNTRPLLQVCTTPLNKIRTPVPILSIGSLKSPRQLGRNKACFPMGLVGVH